VHCFHAARVRPGVPTANWIFVGFGVLMGGIFFARMPKEE
jgi:hypothetical protein